MRLKKSVDLKPECCTARSYMDKLGYVARSEEAERRMDKKGHKQTYCAVCLLCRWPEEQKTCDRFVRSEELEAFYEEESSALNSSTASNGEPDAAANL